MNKFNIANQVISLDWDSSYIHKNFLPFQTDELKTDLTLSIQENSTVIEPVSKPLIASEYFRVYQQGNLFYTFYPGSVCLTSCTYDSLTFNGIIHLHTSHTQDIPKEIAASSSDTFVNITEYIFYAVRDIFFIYMQQKGILAIHSSSIIYKDKAYLFSACSGTGKTTHTSMWEKYYHVEILDGDVAAITMEGSVPVAYGLPWCGTSERFLNQRVPLGGIIFLEQLCHNVVTPLNMFESTVRIAARCFTPTWSAELAQKNIDCAKQFASCVPCFTLGCLPNKEAVDLIKQYIDQL